MTEQGKVYIEYQFRDGPYGGANQFLKSLKGYLISRDLYTEKKEDAEFILLNHTNVSADTLELKKKCHEKIFVHRMDGPVSKHRKRSKAIDRQSFFLDAILCNGTVFQSSWTQDNCEKIGYKKTGLTTIIHNAPDPTIFTRKEHVAKSENDKIHLVATSWSPNRNKGFDILEYLDKNLDYNRYEFTFIGNSPIEFENIKRLEPLDSKAMAEELKKYDIYIATSKSESCSNALLEAMNCGLVPVARNSGCYPEIVGQGGEIAKSLEEFPVKIDIVAEDLVKYQKVLPYFEREKAGADYYAFMESVKNALQKGEIRPKKISNINIMQWKLYALYIKVYQKLVRMFEAL